MISLCEFCHENPPIPGKMQLAGTDIPFCQACLDRWKANAKPVVGGIIPNTEIFWRNRETDAQ